MFVSPTGAAIGSIDEWLRARQYLPGGRASRLLARRWLDAGGLPQRFAAAFAGSPLQGLRLERAVVGHHGRVPGLEGHAGEVVGEATHPAGGVLLGVDGALDDALGGGESSWMQRAGGGDARRTRRAGAAARVGLPAAAVPVEAWPLVHRLLACVDEAARLGRPRAVVAVHSFLPDASRAGSGFALFRHLGGAMCVDRPPPAPDAAWRGPRVGAVDVWMVWVTDDWAELQGVRRSLSPT